MNVLGKSVRVLYTGKNLRQGLTDVQAQVYKPNGSIVGPYPLLELPGLFQGGYYFDFPNTVFDPEGDYIAVVESPTENHRAYAKFSLFRQFAEDVDDDNDELEVEFNDPDSTLALEAGSNEPLGLDISDGNVVLEFKTDSNVDLSIDDDSLEFENKDEQLTIELEDCQCI